MRGMIDDADCGESAEAALGPNSPTKRMFTDYFLPREVIEEAHFYYPSAFKDRKKDNGSLVLLIPKDIVRALDISHISSSSAGKKSFRVIIVRTK